MNAFSAPLRFFESDGWRRFAEAAFLVAVAAVAICFPIVIYLIAQAPTEAAMGIVQKIFYFHVPIAYAMYVAFGIGVVAAIVAIVTRSPRADSIALAGNELGLLLTLLVLITGPLWARKSWGVYWKWDPRLTTTLLAGLVFAAAYAIRSLGAAGRAERRIAAVVMVIGAIDLPIIHYSVRYWRGQHPEVIMGGGGGITKEMVPPLLASFGLWTLLTVVLIAARARVEHTRLLLESLDANTQGD